MTYPDDYLDLAAWEVEMLDHANQCLRQLTEALEDPGRTTYPSVLLGLHEALRALDAFGACAWWAAA
jgi:hypothetical protein